MKPSSSQLIAQLLVQVKDATPLRLSFSCLPDLFRQGGRFLPLASPNSRSHHSSNRIKRWPMLPKVFFAAFLFMLYEFPAMPTEANRVQLTLDTSEADQVLVILTARSAGKLI